METLEQEIDRIAEDTQFSGAVRVDRGDQLELAKAYGMAHRALEVANTVETQFGIASATKGMTALAVVSLIVEGSLALATTARSGLGSDLPLIDDAVTVEHLLSHRSGIGDYLDEDADHDITDYVMRAPAHELATTEQHLAVLDGHPAKFPAGEQFSYCNGGFVVLALIAERVSGVPFHNLVIARVCEPAGMADTAFLRSDQATRSRRVGLRRDRRGAANQCVAPAGARKRRRWHVLDGGRYPVAVGGILCRQGGAGRMGVGDDTAAQCCLRQGAIRARLLA